MIQNVNRHHVLMLLAATTAAAAGASAQQFEYRLIIIEPWDLGYRYATSIAEGLNNLNQVSGCATPLSGNCSFLWTLEGDKVPFDHSGVINDAGDIAGGDLFRYADGSMTTMPGFSYAREITESRIVAGYSSGRYWGGCRWTRSAKVWDEVNGTRSLIDLGVPAAHEARAVNEHGEIVGVRSTTGSCGDFEAFLYDLGTGEHVDIHRELLGSAMGITEAFDINDAGVVVGEGPYGDQIGEVGPFIWRRGEGFTFLPAPDGGNTMHTHPHGINNRGQIVLAGIIDYQAWHGLIWDERNGMRDLNDLTEGIPQDFIIDRASAINENGWIIGSGHYGAWSPERAVVLVPIEPGPDCAAIRKFSAKCRDGKLTAKVVSSLPEGTELTLTRNGGDEKTITINARGKGKAKWTGLSGAQEARIVECPEQGTSADCL